MKKFIFLAYILMFCLFLTVYYNKNNEYKKISNNLNKYDVGYQAKIEELETEYNELMNNINIISETEVKDKEDILSLKSSLNLMYEEYIQINEDLNSKKISLTEQKDTLTYQYNKLLEEERKSFIINNVPRINQYISGYPTGCESVALTILLRYWNVNVSVSDVVNALEKGSLPYYSNGIKYGGNPYLEFVGHPNSYASYGAYDIPIENVANKFKSGIINAKGKSLNDILAIVREGRPVIVWNSMGLSVPYYSDSWIYPKTGETIYWLANEHAIVVIGYNDSQIITSDSLTGSIRYFDRKTFESRYNVFGKRALYY